MNDLDDLTIGKIVEESNQELEQRLEKITSSRGLLDFIIDMAGLWQVDSYPVVGIESFNGDQGKHYVFKNIVRFCKLELARRRILPLVNNEKDYLLGIIAINKLLGKTEDIKITGGVINNASTVDRRKADRDFDFISEVSGHDRPFNYNYNDYRGHNRPTNHNDINSYPSTSWGQCWPTTPTSGSH